MVSMFGWFDRQMVLKNCYLLGIFEFPISYFNFNENSRKLILIERPEVINLKTNVHNPNTIVI